MNIESQVKFWSPVLVMFISFVSAFIWLQADVAAAEEKIKSLTDNTAAIKLIQEQQQIDGAVYKEILRRLEDSMEQNSLLLEQISRKLP